jgi:hypothetical protein
VFLVDVRRAQVLVLAMRGEADVAVSLAEWALEATVGNRASPTRFVRSLKGAFIPIGGLTSGFPHQGSLGRGGPWGCCLTMFTKQVYRQVDSLDPEGCTYSDRGPDQVFPSGPVRLVRKSETVPMMTDGSPLRSGGET